MPASVRGPVATTVPAPHTRHHHAKGDPLEGFNRTMFGIHQAIDHAVLRPAAMGYKSAVPRPVRSGLRNVLSNLTEPFVFLNFLLQGKPGKAGETFARFAINSTMGWAGLFDLAKRPVFKLPHRDNGFGTTLALYGVKSGPYLFLPLVGPATLRDMVGKSVDDAVLPVGVGAPFDSWEFQLGTGVIGGLDERAEADPELRALFADAIDPYATLRSVYLQDRAAQIEQIRGRHRDKAKAGPALAVPGPAGSAPELDDPLSDPASGSTQPASAAVSSAATPPAVAPAGAAQTTAPAQPQSDAPELQDPLADPAAQGTKP